MLIHVARLMRCSVQPRFAPNTLARKQVDQMKTIIMLSLAVSMIAAVTVLNEARLESRRLAANECQVNHYACFRPAVGFASLH